MYFEGIKYSVICFGRNGFDDDDDWRLLSGNPNAIHIIERNLDKVR